jgi:hypothetical protein
VLSNFRSCSESASVHSVIVFNSRVSVRSECVYLAQDLSQRDLELYSYNEPFSLAHMDYEASLSLIWAPWDGVEGD